MGVTRVVNRRTAVLGLLLVILATAGFGFAASNSVDKSGAGDGAGAISGYDVTGVDYVLDTTDRGIIYQIKFNLASKDAAVTTFPNSVAAQAETNGDWYDCTSTSAAPWSFTCTGGDTTVLAANELRVVAAN